MKTIKCAECRREEYDVANANPHGSKTRKSNSTRKLLWGMILLLVVIAVNLTSCKDEEKQGIQYKVVDSQKTFVGINEQILISAENLNLEDMLALGDIIHREYSGYESAVVSVYDDQKAIDTRDMVLGEMADKTTSDFYDLHMVGVYNKTGNEAVYAIHLNGIANPATKQVKY
jgi:hypothetical protein